MRGMYCGCGCDVLPGLSIGDLSLSGRSMCRLVRVDRDGPRCVGCAASVSRNVLCEAWVFCSRCFLHRLNSTSGEFARLCVAWGSLELCVVCGLVSNAGRGLWCVDCM